MFCVLLVAYLAIGSLFAYNMAISPTAVVVLLLLWPIFLVLMIVGKIINAIQAR